MKVLVAGTFDIIHPGHIYLLSEAGKIGDVYVIVARDSNVSKIKGRNPVFNENERKLIVENLKMVKKAILGDSNGLFKKVEEIRPDIIFLGPDQDDAWIMEKIKKSNLDIKVMHLSKRLNYSSSWTKDVLKRLNNTEGGQER
ncbi:MAG: adenylyltransferase/cytidyltransferase family protein [Candidatus Methanofastidiosia archaeon]